MKNSIKILGYGAVVKQFLATAQYQFPHTLFKIYQRSISNCTIGNNLYLNIDEYIPDNDPTFCCLAVDEEKYLRETLATASRLIIAEPNIKLILHFIRKGYFNIGQHFIITNPSDLITEIIIRETGNLAIYGLGLSVDRYRYHSILHVQNIYNKFTLVGNHWHSPLINFIEPTQYNNKEFLTKQLDLLRATVKSEFSGFKPPILSGALAIQHAITSLYKNNLLEVSGFMNEHNTVVAGQLNSLQQKFSPSPANTITTLLLQEAIEYHKKTYAQLLRVIAHENSY